jgi:putative aldouronate transport system substrate-binding protein
MKKRILSLVLIITVFVTMLSGCAKKSDNSPVNGSSTETGTKGQSSTGNTGEASVTKTAAGEYTKEKPYHLVFSYIEFYEQDDSARAAVQDAINAYMVPNYHIEVELLPLQYADYQSTIQLMFSGGDALDIIPVHYSSAASWNAMGGIYDMTKLMKTDDGKKIIEALGEDNAYVGTMNGVLYGFPANKESVELGGLFMRKDICDELGITKEYGLTDNKDEFDGTYYDWSVAADIFAKVKAAKPDMIPLYMSSTDQLPRFAFFDDLIDGFGTLDWEADHSSTKVVNKFETETYKKTAMMLADWYDKGYIYKDAATDTQGSATMMRAGNTFSYLTAIKPGFLAEAESANGCEGYAMYFNTHKEGGMSTTNVNFFNTGISTNSADPEMAFKFISALYSDSELMNLWQYGIKDTNYKMLDDGTVFFADGEDGSNYKYHQNTGWFMGNQYISYVWNDGTKTADYWDKLKKHNDWAELSPAFGFMWDSTQYTTELTALNNALNTYRAALNTGSIGSENVESTIKQLNDALNAAGLQDIMDAKQKQLDLWLSGQNK